MALHKRAPDPVLAPGMVPTEYDILVAYLPQLTGRVIMEPDGRTGAEVTTFEVRERRRAGRVMRWVDVTVLERRKSSYGSGYLYTGSRDYRVRSTDDVRKLLPESILDVAHRLHIQDVIGRLALLPPDLRRYLLARY